MISIATAVMSLFGSGAVAQNAPNYTQQSSGLKVTLNGCSISRHEVTFQITIANVSTARAYLAVSNNGDAVSPAISASDKLHYQEISGIPGCGSVETCLSSGNGTVRDFNQMTYIDPGTYTEITTKFQGNNNINQSDSINIPLALIVRAMAIDNTKLPDTPQRPPSAAQVARFNFPHVPLKFCE